MDILTILGLILGLGSVYYVMAQGGITALLVNSNAFLLVFGGTFASTMITYPWSIIKRIPRTVLFIISPPKKVNMSSIIDKLVDMQTTAFSKGLDALSDELPSIKDNFMKSAIKMLIEDQDADSITENLSNEIMAIRHRHQQVISVYRSMGAYSPIFGLLGTLIGVVQVLKNLSDPASMGTSMAIAITTTFYGIFGCNFLFLPIAGKLDGYSNEELLTKELILVGILSIKEKTLPVLLRGKLERFLSEKQRGKK